MPFVAQQTVNLVKMTDSKEAEQLRKEIAFLTNLISNAKQSKPQSSYASVNTHTPIPWQDSSVTNRKPRQQEEVVNKHQKSSRSVYIKTPWHNVPGTTSHTARREIETFQEHHKSSKYSFKQSQVVSTNQCVPIPSSSVATSSVLPNDVAKSSCYSVSKSSNKLLGSNSSKFELKSKAAKSSDKISASNRGSIIKSKVSPFCDSISNTGSDVTQSKTSQLAVTQLRTSKLAATQCKSSKSPVTQFETSKAAERQIKSSKSPVTKVKTFRSAETHLKTSQSCAGLYLVSSIEASSKALVNAPQNELKQKAKLNSSQPISENTNVLMSSELQVSSLSRNKSGEKSVFSKKQFAFNDKGTDASIDKGTDASILQVPKCDLPQYGTQEKSSNLLVNVNKFDSEVADGSHGGTITVAKETQKCEIPQNGSSHKTKHSPTPVIGSDIDVAKCRQTVLQTIALTSKPSSMASDGIQTLEESALHTSALTSKPNSMASDGIQTLEESAVHTSALTSKPSSMASDGIQTLEESALHTSALISKPSTSVPNDVLTSTIHQASFRPHKHSLSKLFRKKVLTSSGNMDVFSNSGNKHHRLQADFIPLSMSSDSLITTARSSISHDCPKDSFIHLNKSSNSSIPLVTTAELSSSHSRDSSKDSFIPLNKSSNACSSTAPSSTNSYQSPTDPFIPLNKSSNTCSSTAASSNNSYESPTNSFIPLNKSSNTCSSRAPSSTNSHESPTDSFIPLNKSSNTCSSTAASSTNSHESPTDSFVSFKTTDFFSSMAKSEYPIKSFVQSSDSLSVDSGVSSQSVVSVYLVTQLSTRSDVKTDAVQKRKEVSVNVPKEKAVPVSVSKDTTSLKRSSFEDSVIKLPASRHSVFDTSSSSSVQTIPKKTESNSDSSSPVFKSLLLNPSSPVRNCSLPNPSSPLRMQKVAVLMSNLQKTRSKIEDLKENIGGILERKSKELPKTSLVMSTNKAVKMSHAKRTRRGSVIDKQKLLKHRKLLGKVWVRQQSVEPSVRIPVNEATCSFVKTKYRIVKGYKSVSKQVLHQVVPPARTFHSISKFKCFRRHNSFPASSNIQHAAKVIVGKYKTPHSLVQRADVSIHNPRGISISYHRSLYRAADKHSVTRSLQWNAHHTQKAWIHGRSRGYGYNAAHSWSRGHWGNSGHHASLWKADIARRLQLITSQSHLSARRTLGVSGKMSDKSGTKPARLVFIHGILYKSSGNKLTKTGSKSVDHRTTRRNKATTAVIVKKVNTGGMKTISVRGVKFHMDSSGHSLRRADAIQAHSSRTAVHSQHSLPKISRVDIGGVTYIQTRPGTLVKSSSMRTRVVMSRIKNRSIVSATAKFRKDNTRAVKNLCKYYNRFGKCRRGADCPYVHDPDKIAICTRFLRGTCKIQGCLFSHKVSKEKVPVCSYFLRGVCNRDNCPYLHVKVNKDAAVCPDFINGFCPLGEKCKKQHTLVCPVFLRTGVCPQGDKCSMMHKRRRLSKLKKQLNSYPGLSSAGKSVLGKRTAREAGVEEDGVDVVHSKRQELPSFISLQNYNVDDILSPVADRTTSAHKGPALCIKPQL